MRDELAWYTLGFFSGVGIGAALIVWLLDRW